MTVEEMKEALNKHCQSVSSCDACVLFGKARCYSEASDAEVRENYMIVLGCTSNSVNHPSHYQGKHECIDEMIALFGVEAVKAFCKCNVYKYRYRAAAKNGQEDLDKADWYMDKLMELEGENDEKVDC